MNTTGKISIYIILSLLCFTCTGWIISTYIIDPTFRDIEENQAIDQASRGSAILKNSSEQISAIISDWANWDATYDYVVDKNEKYYRENLRNWTLNSRDLQIHVVFMLNVRGEVVFQHFTDARLDSNVYLEPFKTKSILNSKLVTESIKERKRTIGYLPTRYGLLILSAGQILKTDASGTSRGTLIFGRFIDKTAINKINDELKLNLDLILPDYKTTGQNEFINVSQSSNNTREIIRLDRKNIYVFEWRKDIFGKNSILLRTKVFSDIPSISSGITVKIMVIIGVLVLILITTIVLKNRKNLNNSFKFDGIPHSGAFFVAIFGLLVSIGFSLILYKNIQTEKTDAFRRIAESQLVEIEDKLHQDITELEEIERFILDGDATNREQFRRFVEPYLKNMNFQAIEWIPQVDKAGRGPFEALAHMDGLSDFCFTEMGPMGKKVPASVHEYYYPVYYVEPQDKNLEALGYSPTHLKMRNDAIEHAINSRMASVSAPFRLIQEKAQQLGLMVFVPLDKPVKLRRNNVSAVANNSFIACVYRVDDMVKSARISEVSDKLAIKLEDVTTSSPALLTTMDFPKGLDSNFVIDKIFPYAGRNYRISAAALPAFFETKSDYSYLYTLIGGFFVTLLVSLYLNEVVTQKVRAEELVKNRTIDLQNSEYRYQTFINMSAEGICRIELRPPINQNDDAAVNASKLIHHAYIAECNQVFVQQCGYNPSTDLSGLKWADVVSESLPSMQKFSEAIIANDFRIVEYEFEFTNARGENLILRENISSIRENGEIIQIWINQADITSKKRSEIALKESEARFRTLAENSPELIQRFDNELNFLYTNAGIRKLLPLPVENYIGKPLQTFFNNRAVLSEVENAIYQVFQTKKPHRVEIFFSNNLWIDWLLFPEYDSDGNVKEVITSARDISDLKQTETELREAKDKAEESDRLKSAFLANMSHEIRTPMNAILGYSELLDDPELTVEERNDFTKKLRRRTKDLLNLINDILDLSKIEAGQMQLFESDCYLDKVMAYMKDVCHGFQITEKKNIEFSFQLEMNDRVPVIKVDENRLKQILVNLLNNSYKFTESGTISLTCRSHNNDVIFTITDTGIGIPEEKQKNIFERFRQGDDESFSKKFGGSGLGLAIVKGLLDKMGGRIEMASEVNVGTTINIVFPGKV